MREGKTMREILFRGQQAFSGEWVEGCLVKGNNTYIVTPDNARYMAVSVMGHATVDVCMVLHETVGQYTGLTDTNGKKIFEGDIIRWAEKEEYDCWLESLEHPELYDGKPYDWCLSVAVVKYCADNDYPAFEIVPNDFECNGLSELKGWCGDFTFEVVGNIHDNPELIGGHKDAFD